MKLKTIYQTLAEQGEIEVSVQHDLEDSDAYVIEVHTTEDFEYVDIAGARELIRDLQAAIREVKKLGH